MAASTLPAEPDFTQGFGSFNFLLPKECECSVLDATSDSDDMSDILENREASAEPPRSDPGPQEFNFLGLPLEIRRKVYKCLTEELWEDFSMKHDQVRFCATEKAWCGKHRHESPIYCLTVSSDRPDATVAGEPARDLDLSFESRMSTSDEASDTTSVLSSDDSDVDMDDLPPPMPQATIFVNRRFWGWEPRRGFSGVFCKHGTCRNPAKNCRPHPQFYCPCMFEPPAPFIDVINLSQVSRQITRELGECLWERATVKFEDPVTFLMFAHERPAALPLIRGIVLALDCSPEPTHFNTDTDELAAMLSFVSEHLDLRFFNVELRIWLRDNTIGPEAALPNLIGLTAVSWAPLFRGLRTDAFDVKVPDFGPKTPFRWWKSFGLLPRPRAEPAGAAVLQLWKPECVREKEVAEEASYLRSRAVSA